MTDAPAVPTATAPLPGGGAMPLLGFGTWRLRGEEAVRATTAALEAGYRHLDTATMYENETEVGRALRDSGVPRGDVFVTTKLPPDRAAEIGLQLLAALEVLHREGIVHRDVKPGNAMFTGAGDVKLGDLGIAAVAGDVDLTNTGLVLGSPHFMAPEQATGERVDARADLWSLGATLFYAVEGHPPYEGPAIAAMTAIVHEPTPAMASAGRLAPVIRGLMAKDPSERLTIDDARHMLLDEPTVAFERTAAVEPTVAFDRTQSASLRISPSRGEANPHRSAVGANGRAWAAALVAVIALLVGGIALATTLADDPTGTGTEDSPNEAAPPRDEQSATSAPPTTATPTTAARASGTRTFTNPEAGYSVDYPENWTIERRGERIVDLVEPGTGTYLRIDWTAEPGDSPKEAWERQEESFSKEEGYERIQMTEETYQGHPASLWEYTYRAEGHDLHAYNLGFVVGDERGFALNFQTREENWDAAQPTWDQLKANFRIES